MKRWIHWFAALGAVTMLAACGGGDDDPAVAPAPGTLAQEASTRGFSALVAAAGKAGLVDALDSASTRPALPAAATRAEKPRVDAS